MGERMWPEIVACVKSGLVAYAHAPRTLGPNSPVPTPMWRMVHPPTSESLSASPCTAPKQVGGGPSYHASPVGAYGLPLTLTLDCTV